MKQRTIIGILLVPLIVVIWYLSIHQGLFRSDNVDENNVTLTVPGKSHFGAADTYLSMDSGKIEAGKNMAFELRIVKNQEAVRNETITVSQVKGKYSNDELPLPNGLTVNCTPSLFTSYPGKVYDVSIILMTTKEVPEDTYFLRIQRNFDSGIETMWTSIEVTAPT